MRVVFGQSQGKKRKWSPNEGRVWTGPGRKRKLESERIPAGVSVPPAPTMYEKQQGTLTQPYVVGEPPNSCIEGKLF
jgi:hypothetical protein